MTNYIKIGILVAMLLILFFFSDSVFIFSFGWIPGLSVKTAFWIPLLLSICTGILGILFFRKYLDSKVKIGLAILGFMGSCLISFYSNPYYPEDFENRSSSLKLNEEIKEIYLSDTEASITCYLLADCPYCEIASTKLNALYRANKIKDIEFVYHAYQETADNLVSSMNIEVPYRVIENDSIFFLRAGQTFPSVQLVQNDELIYWSGNNVNFACFDFLMSQNDN